MNTQKQSYCEIYPNARNIYIYLAGQRQSYLLFQVKNHWQGVLQGKKTRIDNSLFEGLNSLIQAAKAKARGFRT